MKNTPSKLFSTAFTGLWVLVLLIVGFNTSITANDTYNASELRVVSTYPQDGETGVDHNVILEITMSEVMDSLAIHNFSFSLVQGSDFISGSLTFDGRIASFQPDSALKASSEFVAVVTLGDNYMDDHINDDDPYEYFPSNGKTWSFTSAESHD
ncbi:MAG: Ig-like domain-containing protein [Balneolia bacterium]|nr:Ig-like domain-containing protein [Balneolia bacterium]